MKNRLSTLAVVCVATLLPELVLHAGTSSMPPSGSARPIYTRAEMSAPPGAYQRIGLYDSDAGNITTGELNSQDYWWTKYDAMMLDLALKTRQPEGTIAIDLAVALRRIDDLQKKYPKHEEIQKWKEHFQEIQSKINPDANRGGSFTKECPWDESNFAQLWVNVHWMKFLVDQKNWNDAAPLSSNIRQNYEIMLAPDRMKEYPEDLRKWVVDSKPDAEKMMALVKSKTG